MYYDITDINGISNAVYNYVQSEINYIKNNTDLNSTDIKDLYYLDNTVDCQKIAEKIIEDSDFQEKLGEFIHEYLYSEEV